MRYRLARRGAKAAATAGGTTPPQLRQRKRRAGVAARRVTKRRILFNGEMKKRREARQRRGRKGVEGSVGYGRAESKRRTTTAWRSAYMLSAASCRSAIRNIFASTRHIFAAALVVT